MNKIYVLICLVVVTVQSHALSFSKFDQARDPMPAGGAFRGDVVENVKGRTLELLSADDKRALRLDPGLLAFANFRHHGKFYVAHIPGVHVDTQNNIVSATAMTESVHVISEHWEARANPDLASLESHSYLRFNFPRGHGIVLDYDQARPAHPNLKLKNLPVRSVVLSVEALRPRGNLNAPFIPHAFLFDFAVGHLFYATVDRNRSEDADTTRTNETIPLTFHGEQSAVDGVADPRDALLVRAVQASVRYGRGETYNTVLNNCTNRLIEVLDQALFHDADFDRSIFTHEIDVALRADLPGAFRALGAAMSTRGVSLPESVLTTLIQMSGAQLRTSLAAAARFNPSINTFYSWFPPFVHAHLAARGLIPPG